MTESKSECLQEQEEPFDLNVRSGGIHAACGEMVDDEKEEAAAPYSPPDEACKRGARVNFQEETLGVVKESWQALWICGRPSAESCDAAIPKR